MKQTSGCEVPKIGKEKKLVDFQTCASFTFSYTGIRLYAKTQRKIGGDNRIREGKKIGKN